MCTVFALIAGSTALILSHAIAWLAVPPVVAAMGVAPLYASYHDDRPYRKNPVRYVGVLVLGSAAVAIGIAHLPF